ncbi:hypothetical protein [Fischerella thermalis]|uniref:hypothetical protein n=1 Tax=Fischerella thermalis TaxID=372787 RepID=UPI001A0D153E|nr:hypothetical protein [Fischerella thermalis]MBF1990956.1 hypothetical protein [Fischerella thermalis M58_A2018_009]MBF2062579.1 hypothetical protein [Fischerella thermalis M66_A2018_004]
MKSVIKLILKASLVGTLSLSLSVQSVYASPSPISVPIEVSDSNDDVNAKKVFAIVSKDEQVGTLNQIGEYSKTIYNLIKTNNWTEAKHHLSLLKAVSDSFKTQKGRTDVNLAKLDSSITVLQSTVAAKNHQAMCDANQVSAIAAQLAMQLEPKMPLEVAMLDYYGRELEIWAADKNTARLKNVAGKIRETWEALRPAIQSHGGSPQLLKFDDTLVALVETASSPTEYSLLAAPVQGEVNNLRKVFQQ